jgi:hypothetical protein
LESLLVLKDVIDNQFFLDKLIFIDKNWPNDLRIGCESPFSLAELIETNVYLKEELKEFEKKLEEMKLWNCKFWIKKFLQFTSFQLFLAILKV